MENIAVSGGAGFIGSALCHYLVKTGKYQVLNIDKLTYAANPLSVAGLEATGRYQHAQIDICETDKLFDLFKTAQIDAVFHLAAESHVDRSITEPGQFITTNLVGTYSMLEAARRYWQSQSAEKAQSFRFLHVSTDEVYGALGAQGTFHETTAYAPNSPYSASKAGSDHLVHAWYKTYGLPVIISNCSNNYGPRQFPEKLIPLTILNALTHERLPVYGDGSNIRDWLHVEDHVQALVLLARDGKPGQKYNIGGGGEKTNLAVVEAICECLATRVPAPKGGFRALIEFVPDRPGHDFRYAVDAKKMTTELGWKPSIDFNSGLADTIDWYLNNAKWWEFLRSK